MQNSWSGAAGLPWRDSTRHPPAPRDCGARWGGHLAGRLGSTRRHHHGSCDAAPRPAVGPCKREGDDRTQWSGTLLTPSGRYCAWRPPAHS